MSNRRVLLLIAAVFVIGIILYWVSQAGKSGNQETGPGGKSNVPEATARSGDGDPSSATQRTQRRSEEGDDEGVNALLTDTSLKDKEAGARLLQLAIRLEKENKNGAEALTHATHLLDESDYPKLLKWFEASPPERRLAEVALLDSSARGRVNQCKLRLALLKSPDQSVRMEAIDELRFLLELSDTADEQEVRLALGGLIEKEANRDQGETK